MRFTPSILGKLLEPIQRRQFDTLVEAPRGDAYVKSFPSWNHLLALVYASSPRRSACGVWKRAGMQPSASLPSGQRPAGALDPGRCQQARRVAIFAETFSLVASQLDRQTRRDGAAMVKLIDATPFRSASCAIGPNRTGASAA